MNMHWRTSAVVRMAMLLLLAVIVSTATTGAVPTGAVPTGAVSAHSNRRSVTTQSHNGRLRVGRPCSGRHAVETVDLPSSTDEDNRVSRHRLRRAVRRIRNLFAALYRDVNQLKTDYVSILVRDIAIVVVLIA